jgi:menaquinone-specific isochorismate synthase
VSVDTDRLVARTRAIPASDVDLFAFCGERGMVWTDGRDGLAGIGEALRIDLPGGLADEAAVEAVTLALAAIRSDDDVGLPGCGPVAFGALPFDRHRTGSLVVPARLVGVREGVAWETTIDPAPPVVGFPKSGEAPDQFTLVSARPHARWRQVVADAVAHVQSGALEKVVLARCVDVVANRPFIVTEILERLGSLYPTCMVFSIDGFMGASPELLIRREGAHVSSHPLAGTVARSGDDAADEALVAGLLASPKERWEHQLVVEALAKGLREVCPTLDVPTTPDVVGLRNVSHLGTRLTGRSEGNESALDLVARVHPTPAVGGWPTAEATAYQQVVEDFDRCRYAGPVGWVDARGDGAWAVGIRCADIDGARARLYAGGGIVADSDPAAELAETQLKLQALLAALVRP